MSERILALSLELIAPFVAVLISILLLTAYTKIRRPTPLVWGRIIRRVCIVRTQEVLDYNRKSEAEKPYGRRLRREARRQQFKVNWEYLRAQATNTNLFQRSLLFDKIKIDPIKPGMKYGRREIVVLELLDYATDLRWQQVRSQVTLLLRSRLGLPIDKEIFLTLLAQYKDLEAQVILLAEAEGEWLKTMLVERLGLMEWRVIEGGHSDPEPA